MVMITLPLACVSFTYRSASAPSSRAKTRSMTGISDPD
jgi:hypothetical protein